MTTSGSSLLVLSHIQVDIYVTVVMRKPEQEARLIVFRLPLVIAEIIIYNLELMEKTYRRIWCDKKRNG